MVSCPFNGKEVSKCFVTAQGWTRVILLVLGQWPSLGWRAWKYYLSLIMIVDNIGGLLGPINCPLIPGVVHTLDDRRNIRRFVHFRTDAHTWLGMIRYLHTYRYTYIYIYIYIWSSHFFLFFFLFFFFYYCDAWGFVLHWWLNGGVAHVVATCSTSIDWEASFPVEIFSIFPHFPRQRAFWSLSFPFALLSSCYFLTFLLRVVSPTS